MSKNDGLLVIAIKKIMFIYIPFLFIINFLYRIIFKIDMSYSKVAIIIYVIIFSIVNSMNYLQRTMEHNVKDFNSLKESLVERKWSIIEESDNSLIVKPKFDYPFRLMIDSRLKINYTDQKAIVKGPFYYVNNIIKDISGKPSIWTKKYANSLIVIILVLIISIPIFNDLGFFWKIKMDLHNNFAEKVTEINIDLDDNLGNSAQNINNQGLGVENDDYIFYVEKHLNLVRVNKNFQDKTYLIYKTSGNGISRLNLADDWIFYTSGKNLNRIRIDGTNNETIYKLGYLLDVHMKNNYFYFINFPDKSYIYKMDINGRNLERFLKVNASDIALYDNKMLVSYKDNNSNFYVESINLDNTERNIDLELEAYSLVKWEEYYYFIGEDFKLYRNKIGEKTDSELLVNKKVSSYVITENGLFYSLHSENFGYPGEGIYIMDLDGANKKQISEKQGIEGFTKLGNFILFHSFDRESELETQKLNIFTMEIEGIQ